MTASSPPFPPGGRAAVAGSFSILLIEDNPGDARLIREQLHEAAHTRFDVRHAETLAAGLAGLAAAIPDIVLLDLSLPDSQGLDTVARVCAWAPEVPVVVLTGADNEGLAVAAVQSGAQAYLVKGQMDGPQLARAVRNSIERVKRQRQLQALAMEDDLTGLHNRLSFAILVRQAMKVAKRTGGALKLLLMDADALKQRRDESWQGGDQALLETANLLRATFRESDILARLSDTEFGVLAAVSPADRCDNLPARLKRNLEVHNASVEGRPGLAFGLGVAEYDPQHPCTVDELLARANRSLYVDLLRLWKQ